MWKTGFKIKFIKAAGRQIGYMERGQPKEGKPSMLFLHGFTDRKETWCEIIKVQVKYSWFLMAKAIFVYIFFPS